MIDHKTATDLLLLLDERLNDIVYYVWPDGNKLIRRYRIDGVTIDDGKAVCLAQLDGIIKASGGAKLDPTRMFNTMGSALAFRDAERIESEQE